MILKTENRKKQIKRGTFMVLFLFVLIVYKLNK
jgi:hypothetical protein